MGMKSDSGTEPALSAHSWRNHSVIFVNSVADGWRICRQVGNISAIFAKKRAMSMRVLEKKI
jgi:hypothetical protein